MAKKSKVDFRKVKDQAARALRKQSWGKALEKYEILIKEQPKDLRLQMKKGDILAKMKKLDEAFQTYDTVIEEYTKGGFLIQAISVVRIIQQLDPKRDGMDEKLEELNQLRGVPTGAPKPATAPDAEPGLESVSKDKDTDIKAELEQAKQKQEEAEKKDPEFAFPETPLFGQLGPEEFTKVVSKCQVGTIPRLTQIIKEGTKGDAIFIVSQGDVRVYYTHPKSGKKVTLAHLKDGAFFGEMAIFLDSIRTASVDAAVETTLLRINREDLEEMMEEYPNIRQVMHDFFKKRALDQLLQDMPLFESFDLAEREVLADKFELLEVEETTEIIREGEEGEHLYVIYSGEVEITSQHDEKGTIKIATLTKGEYFGEISMLQDRPATADVVSSSKCVLFRLSRSIFKDLMAIHSHMLEEISTTIEDRVEVMELLTTM
jgi:CRP-like cAMP-binding protein